MLYTPITHLHWQFLFSSNDPSKVQKYAYIERKEETCTSPRGHLYERKPLSPLTTHSVFQPQYTIQSPLTDTIFIGRTVTKRNDNNNHDNNL